MTSDFHKLAKRFHEAEFVESSVQFSDSLTALTWTPSGNIIVGDLQGKLHSVDVTSNTPTVNDEQSVTAGSRITDIAINLSGDLFASTSFNSEDVSLGDIHSSSGKFGGAVSSIRCSEKPVCVSFLEDQRSRQCLLLIGGRRGIKVHDVESGGVFRTLESKSIFTSIHSWSGCMLMSGTSDGEVTLWDIRRPQVLATFGKRVTGSGRAIFSVDSGARLLSLVGNDGEVEFYDIGAKKLIIRKKIMEGIPGSLSFSRKSRFLAISDEEKLKIVNLNDFSVSPMPFPSKLVRELNKVTGIRWHPEKCEFATRSTDKMLRMFKVGCKEDVANKTE